MSKYEIFTLTITLLAWIASLITQLFILSKQNTFQRKLTELQNNLSARREIASTMLGNLSLMTNWLEEGLEIQGDMLHIEKFLKDREFVDPTPDRLKITNRINTWSNSSKRLIYLAQIYDPKFNKSTREWNYQLGEELPEDLPRLLESFQRILHSYFWKQLTEYDYCFEPFPLPPEEEEFLARLIPEAGKYIIPVYQKSHVSLERVREFVVTEPLSPI